MMPQADDTVFSACNEPMKSAARFESGPRGALEKWPRTGHRGTSRAARQAGEANQTGFHGGVAIISD